MSYHPIRLKGLLELILSAWFDLLPLIIGPIERVKPHSRLFRHRRLTGAEGYHIPWVKSVAVPYSRGCRGGS